MSYAAYYFCAMENEIKTTPNAADRLKEEYYRQSEAIVEHAKANGRRLSADDMKQLRELNRAIKDLNEAVSPCEEDKLIVIRPKLPDGWKWPPIDPTPDKTE